MRSMSSLLFTTALLMPSEFANGQVITQPGEDEPAQQSVSSEYQAYRVEPEDETNLAGRWLLTLPAGWQQRATIERLEDGRYRLPGHGNLNGVYVLEGRTLTLVEHSDDPMPNFVWEVLNDNTLRLRIDENNAGANYLGATMGRQIDWDDFADNSRTTSRLTRPRLTSVPLQFAIRPAIPQEVTLTGQAFNDETQPPYIETEDDIIFIQGIEAWPDDVVGKTITITGALTNGEIADGATTLPARFVQLKTYSVEGGPVVEVPAESREP